MDSVDFKHHVYLLKPQVEIFARFPRFEASLILGLSSLFLVPFNVWEEGVEGRARSKVNLIPPWATNWGHCALTIVSAPWMLCCLIPVGGRFSFLGSWQRLVTAVVSSCHFDKLVNTPRVSLSLSLFLSLSLQSCH